MRHRDIIDVTDPARPAMEALTGDIHAATFGAVSRNPNALTTVREFQDAVLVELYGKAPATAHNIWTRSYYRSIRNSPKSRAWKARAMHFNPGNPMNAIALSGMAPIHDGERWLLGIAYPAPAPLGPIDQEITDIILINPKTGNASLYGDANPALIRPHDQLRFTVHADARTWAREWATARLEWYLSREHARKAANITPVWTPLPPSALAIGDIRKIHWPAATSITASVGVDAKTLRSALFRQANIPHVEQPFEMRVVA